MPLSPHPESARLGPAIERCAHLVVPWAGDLFRFTNMTYANLRDLVTGEGSRKAGGRWNPKEGFRALYFSLDAETALAEVLAQRRRQGLPDADALPLVLFSCRANVERVLDLKDGRTRRVLGVTREQLIAEPWPVMQEAGQEALTQAIGRLAREAALQGLLVPSAARPKGGNLVLFRDQVPEDQLLIINPEHFPAHRSRSRRQKS
ncbi:MAG TPA: RES family NAD+ phosphorylase [Gemmataceae bacterium]|nr:RES family NAD+ phosphorylase [Gemmataceae bacterium]